MYCQMAFSGESFRRLIRYRIADQFRPPTTPLDYPPGGKSWLDGLIVTNIEVNRLEHDRIVVLNEVGADGKLKPNSAMLGYWATAVTLDLVVDVYLASVEAVATAGLEGPDVQTVPIGLGLLHITIRVDVNRDGIPLLIMQIDADRLVNLDLPAPVISQIRAATDSSMPFDIAESLKEFLPPGSNRVVNAGISRDPDGAIMLRFEFSGGSPYPSARAAVWEQFFAESSYSNLGGQDWCLDLDGNTVAQALANRIEKEFKDKKPLRFDAGTPIATFKDGVPPRAVIQKAGRVENACAGNDIRFDLFINADFSVPADNLVRATLSFDIDKDDWDVFKCFVMTAINPVSILITAFDNRHAEIGFIELASNLIFPTRSVILVAGLGLLIAGVDQALAQKVIDDELKDNSRITNVPGGGFAYEQSVPLRNSLTLDWLVLRQAVGVGGRLLLRGALQVPEPVLPKLKASIDGFTKWNLVDRCEPGRGQKTSGTLTLTLDPGYGASQSSARPVVPTIPLKYGVRADGGALAYEILDDPLGIYRDPSTDYRQVYFLGVPGIVEAKLKASTVRRVGFESFGSAPYPLRLRFYTNAGVREYQFAAPPILTEHTETKAEAAVRISRCKQLGSSLLLHNYLELKWRIDPPEMIGPTSQQWDVHVYGLESGRRATVWNRQTGESLVKAYADHTGRIDLSMVMSGDQVTGALLMGLDENEFTPHVDLQSDIAIQSETNVKVVMQQTNLIQIGSMQFEDSVESIRFTSAGANGVMLIRTQGGRTSSWAIPLPYGLGCEFPVSVGDEETPMDGAQCGQLAWVGNQRRFTLVSNKSGRPQVLSEYMGRSSLDLGARRGDLFAQVCGDGRTVTLFQRGAPLLFGELQWEEESVEPSATTLD